MTAAEDRLQRIEIGLSIINNAQRELRKIKIKLNREYYVIEPILLFDYQDNEDYHLSPFVMEFNQFAKSFQLDMVDEMEMLSEQIDPSENGIINLWSDEDLESKVKVAGNAKLIGRVKFPTINR